ncbi:MAG: FecR domain-containing protein, partial [Bacteroidota bacterium]
MLHNSEKYKEFSAVDFATDEVFQEWIISGRRAEVWQNWISNNTEKEAAITQAKTLIFLMKDEEKEIGDVQIQNLWQRIYNDIDKSEGNVKETPVIAMQKRSVWKVSTSIAASIMLLLGFFWWWTTVEQVYETGIQEQLVVDLPDGSKATLNSGSKISFSKNNWDTERKVLLNGEAFFEVKEGKKFTVQTQIGKVEVLGTSFNVLKRNQRFEVACFTGKVGVSNSFDVQEILLPGKKIIVMSDKVQLDDFLPAEIVSWKRGVFEFDNVLLDEVLAELKRQYGFEVKVQVDI